MNRNASKMAARFRMHVSSTTKDTKHTKAARGVCAEHFVSLVYFAALYPWSTIHIAMNRTTNRFRSDNFIHRRVSRKLPALVRFVVAKTCHQVPPNIRPARSPGIDVRTLRAIPLTALEFPPTAILFADYFAQLGKSVLRATLTFGEF